MSHDPYTVSLKVNEKICNNGTYNAGELVSSNYPPIIRAPGDGGVKSARCSDIESYGLYGTSETMAGRSEPRPRLLLGRIYLGYYPLLWIISRFLQDNQCVQPPLRHPQQLQLLSRPRPQNTGRGARVTLSLPWGGGGAITAYSL